MAARNVVFIHGLWLHATSWNPWMELFPRGRVRPHRARLARRGRHRRGGARDPESVANIGINDATGHYADIIDGLDEQPIIIGHSFGGLIAEKLLGQGVGGAAVAIDPAQIKGVLPLPLAQLRAGFPALGNPANLHKAVSLTQKEFRFGFGNALSEEESDELFEKWTIPSPARPLFQAPRPTSHALPGEGRHRQRHPGSAAADLRPGGPHRAGRGDPVDPEAVPRLRRGDRAQAVRGRGHSLTVDSGWPDVADAVLDWLKANGL